MNSAARVRVPAGGGTVFASGSVVGRGQTRTHDARVVASIKRVVVRTRQAGRPA
jgi:hypothetical protein